MSERERLPQLITDGETNEDMSWAAVAFVAVLLGSLILLAIYSGASTCGSEEESKQSASGSKGESSLQAPSREK